MVERKPLQFALVVTLLLASGNAPCDDLQARHAAEELLVLNSPDKILAESRAQIAQIMTARIEAKVHVPDAYKDRVSRYQERIVDLLVKEMSVEKMRDSYVELYVSVFTAEELQALVEFYKTPAGQSFAAKLPIFSKRFGAAIEARAIQLQPALAKLQAEFTADMMAPQQSTTDDAASLRAASSPARVGGRIPEPKKIKHVNPEYPDAAKAAGVQGIVILECTISPQGTVTDVKVLRGIPMLDEPAITAVRQWVYTPTLLNGVPVPVIMTVTVNFRLGPGRNAPRPD